MKIVIATSNSHKLKEINRLLAPLGIETLSPSQAGVALEVEETGKTFEENARLKAEAFSRACGLAAVADDSGLVVDALGGAPGIHSARFAGEGATDSQRIDKLLYELRSVPETKRTARFVCAVCCFFPDGGPAGGDLVSARSECEGSIAFEPGGTGGFGYDPVFIEGSSGLTFAKLSDAQKDAVSHRGRALRLFAQRLADYKNSLK